MRIARPRVLFIAPTLPALTGNGLAMRMGVFAEALARWADVDLAVVPVAGGGVEKFDFHRRNDAECDSKSIPLAAN